MGGVFGKEDDASEYVPESKLEAKMVDAMKRRALAGSSLKSFDNIILRFPKIDESLRDCETVFKQFDQDSNGTIDQEELVHCFDKLEIPFTEEEIDDLFEACDFNEDMGINFNEFIVLLCLVYLLQGPTAHPTASFLPSLLIMLS